MEQFNLVLKKEVHECLNLFGPPTSFLQTLATLEKIDLPQLMCSTATSRKKK